MKISFVVKRKSHNLFHAFSPALLQFHSHSPLALRFNNHIFLHFTVDLVNLDGFTIFALVRTQFDPHSMFSWRFLSMQFLVGLKPYYFDIKILFWINYPMWMTMMTILFLTWCAFETFSQAHHSLFEGCVFVPRISVYWILPLNLPFIFTQSQRKIERDDFHFFFRSTNLL